MNDPQSDVQQRESGAQDPETVAFWAGEREGLLVFQRCGSCGKVRHPPMPRCPWCGASASEQVVSRGRGRVYSWVRVYEPFRPEDRDDIPYTIATVDMEEGCRMFARFTGRTEPDPIGEVVTVAWAVQGAKSYWLATPVEGGHSGKVRVSA